MQTPTIPTADSDPSGLFGAIGTTAGAVLALLVVLGILDGEAADGILAIVVTLGPLATAWSIRRHAYAPETVDDVAAAAYQSGIRSSGGP